MKNIFELFRIAMSDKNVKPIEFKVLTCILIKSGFKKIYISLKTIGEETGIKSKNDISKYLNKLQSLNYISISRNNVFTDTEGNQRRGNIYTINFGFVPGVKEPETKKRKNKMISIKESNPIETLNKETSEIVIKELNNDNEFYNSLMKSNNERIEVYKKCLMLLFVINKVHSFNPDNFKAYLKKSFQNQSYTEYHKEVFESKIKNNDTYIKEPEADRRFYKKRPIPASQF